MSLGRSSLINATATGTRDCVPYGLPVSLNVCRGRPTGRQSIRVLGIFGVHMPLPYGEGENAFSRLQEEIMRGYGMFQPLHRSTRTAIRGPVVHRICLQSPRTHLPSSAISCTSRMMDVTFRFSQDVLD